MKFLLDFLGKQPKSFILSLSLASIALIWAFNYFFLGDELTLTLIYALPIALAVWYAGAAAGLASAAAATIAWFTVYLGTLPASRPWIPYLNVALKLNLFLAFIYVLSVLKDSLTREAEMARTDFVTGAANNRYFTGRLNAEIVRALRDRQPLTVVYLDLDDFKQVNDRFGHNAGDALLRLVAGTINAHVRISDLVARMGGDEFAVLLPNTGYEAARTAVAKIQAELLSAMRIHDVPTTFSFGVATCPVPPRSPEDLIKMADTLMYRAKTGGKNAVRHEVCGPAAREALRK